MASTRTAEHPDRLPQGDLRLLETDLAQQLLRSSIPARLAFLATDGTPRVVPTWFEWNGAEIIMVTYVAGPNAGIRHPAARIAALRANPTVALTIDTEQFPSQSLTIRGRAEIDEVDGLAPEYVASAHRYLGDAAAGMLASMDPTRNGAGPDRGPSHLGRAARLRHPSAWPAGRSVSSPRRRRTTDMSKVFCAHAVSVDGYITGRDPGPGRGLGDGSTLFNWYFDGDTPSQIFDGFRLSEPSARVFDTGAGRVGAVVAGRNTYEDSEHFGGGSPHPTARLVVLSHRPAPEITERQTLVATGIADAIAAAREAAGDKDVGLMGGGVVTAALQAALVDELILHQVPVLLGGGRPFFQGLPDHVRLRLIEVVPAPGVTHLHYEVAR